MTTVPEVVSPASSLQVRSRIVEALRLDLVGPWSGHPLAEERLPGWVYPSNWYLTGFLIPVATLPEKAADESEQEELGVVAPGGLAEESNEDRKAAKKGYFPSSIGLSFLVSTAARSLDVTVRWGEYEKGEVPGDEGKPTPIWQRWSREVPVTVHLTGVASPRPVPVSASGGLELQAVERAEAGDAAAADQLVRRFAARFWKHEWPGKAHPRVLYDPRALEPDGPGGVLHAKAVVTDEESVFITSANLTEAALDSNIELGLVVRDRTLAASVAAHFQSLVDLKLLVPMPGE